MTSGSGDTAKFQASIDRLAKLELALQEATKELESLIAEHSTQRSLIKSLFDGGRDTSAPAEKRVPPGDSELKVLRAIDNLLAGMVSVDEKAQLVAEEMCRLPRRNGWSSESVMTPEGA